MWGCRGEQPVQADWSADIDSHCDTGFLGSVLAEFPGQELASFVTRGAVASSGASGFAMVLGSHFTSLAAGFAEAFAKVDEFCDLGRFAVIREPAFPIVPCRFCPNGTVT